MPGWAHLERMTDADASTWLPKFLALPKEGLLNFMLHGSSEPDDGFSQEGEPSMLGAAVRYYSANAVAFNMTLHLLRRLDAAAVYRVMAASDGAGITPLMDSCAVTPPSLHLMEMLLSVGARSVVNATDHTRRSALMLCASHDFGSGVSLLLHSGADIAQRDERGDTALSHACAVRASTMAVLLATDAPFDGPTLRVCAWPLLTGALTWSVPLALLVIVLPVVGLRSAAAVAEERRGGEPPPTDRDAGAGRAHDARGEARRRRKARRPAEPAHRHPHPAARSTRLLQQMRRLSETKLVGALGQWAHTRLGGANVFVCSVSAGAMMILLLSAGRRSEEVVAAIPSPHSAASVGNVWRIMLFYLAAVVLAAALMPDVPTTDEGRGNDSADAPLEENTARSAAAPAANPPECRPPRPPRPPPLRWSRVNALAYTCLHHFVMRRHGLLKPLQSLDALMEAALHCRGGGSSAPPFCLTLLVRCWISLHHLIWLTLPMLCLVLGLQLTARLRKACPPWTAFRLASLAFGGNDLLLLVGISDYLTIVSLGGASDPLTPPSASQLRLLHGHALAHASIHLLCALLFTAPCRHQLAAWRRVLVRKLYGTLADALSRRAERPIAAAAATRYATEQSPALESSVRECILCFDAEASHILAPCGHKCVCGSCACLLTESHSPCPLCRLPILSVVHQVYS